MPKSFLKEYKVLQRKLSYEVPVYKFTGEVNKVQTTKFDSIDKPHPPLKDEALNDNKETLLSSIESADESGEQQESQAISPDGTLSPYEVIDGTTVYLDAPSISSSSVSDVAAQATRLVNKQDAVSESDTDSGTVTGHAEPSSDKNSLEESQADTKDAGVVEVIETDTADETSGEVNLESSEAINDSILSTDSKDDILTLNGNSDPSKEEKPSEIAELGEESSDKSGEESSAEDEKEEAGDNAENEGIFASLTNTLKMLSSSDETAKYAQSSDSSTSVADNKVTTADMSQDEISKEKSEIEDVADKSGATPTVQEEMDSDLEPDFVSKEKIEQEIKNTVREEASSVPSETIESPSNVPSDNFVHVDADKRTDEPANLVPIDTSTDINSHANIQAQEANEKEVTVGTVGIAEEPTVLSNTREIVAKESGSAARESSDIGQELPQDTDKIPETGELPSSLEETAGSTKSESVSETVGEKTEITDETSGQSAASSQPNEENVIVHTNVNTNDNLIAESVSDDVPKQSDEFSDGTKPSTADQSVDTSHKSVISEETATLSQDSQKNLPNIEENSEYTNSKLYNEIINGIREL